MAGFLNPPPPPAIVEVTEDHGGVVGIYAARLIAYKHEGRDIRIKGLCNSACTMALGLSTVCVYPQARLGFHLPRYDLAAGETHARQPLSPDAAETRLLWSLYPEGIRSRLGALTANMRYLSGSEAIAAGIRACPE